MSVIKAYYYIVDQKSTKIIADIKTDFVVILTIEFKMLTKVTSQGD